MTMAKPNRHERRAQEKKSGKISNQIDQSALTHQIQFDPRGLFAYGPILTVLIGLPTAVEEDFKAKEKPIPAPVPCKLLLDTGATRSYITPEIADKVGLPVIDDAAEIIGAGAVTAGKKHFGKIIFNFPTNIGGQQVVQQVWVETEITSGKLPKAHHIDGLIGRDVLSHFEFNYNGKTGLLKMTFLAA